jgi:hypothetical protein
MERDHELYFYSISVLLSEEDYDTLEFMEATELQLRIILSDSDDKTTEFSSPNDDGVMKFNSTIQYNVPASLVETVCCYDIMIVKNFGVISILYLSISTYRMYDSSLSLRVQFPIQ